MYTYIYIYIYIYIYTHIYIYILYTYAFSIKQCTQMYTVCIYSSVASLPVLMSV